VLVLAQPAGRRRLRDVAYSLASQANALAPLGLRPPKRLTLAEANAWRPMALYQALVALLSTRCRAVAPKHRFRCKNPLFSLASTTISMCLSLCPWVRVRTNGAIDVPTLLDPAGHVPAVVVLTEGKRRDLAAARGLHQPMESIVTRDRSDLDSQVLFRLHQQGVYFVTRQKVNTHVHVMARLAVDRATGLTADYGIVLKSTRHPSTDRRTTP
jgi:hypothetical protein